MEKKKIAIYAGATLAVYLLGFGIGNSGATSTLDGKKVNAVSLEKAVAKLEDSKKKIEGEMKKLEYEKKTAYDDYLKQQNDNKQLFDTIAKKDQIVKDTQSAQQNLDSVKSQLGQANSDLKSKQSELASVTGQITKAKGAPKILPAGTYTAGSDFPSGRYIATPVGSGSNFVTFDASGTPDVNTILGSGGEPSYTFEISDGYKLQTESTVKLTPVE
jgi:hypothetical protein